MRIIITSIKNIKNFFTKELLYEIALTISIMSIAIIIFFAGALFQQHRFSKVYPLSIVYDEESREVWDSYLENREKNAHYVASKTGTKFYPITCSYARRIKEENRMYFLSKDDARGLDLQESENC